MSAHDQKIKEAKDAIQRLYTDTSVSQSQTKESLEELISHLEILAEGLEV